MYNHFFSLSKRRLCTSINPDEYYMSSENYIYEKREEKERSDENLAEVTAQISRTL